MLFVPTPVISCWGKVRKENRSQANLKRSPDIKIVKCGCHIENLISKKVTKVLQKEFLEVLHAISNYITKSAKRSFNWEILQSKLNVEVLKLLKHSDTRWSSHYDVIVRTLRRWEPVLIFFKYECEEMSPPSVLQSQCGEDLVGEQNRNTDNHSQSQSVLQEEKDGKKSARKKR